MDTAVALSGYRCADCGDATAAENPRICPTCGGPLETELDYDRISPTPDATGADFLQRTGLAPLLGLAPEARRDPGPGETPLVDAGSLADDLGVAGLSIKDEGQHPTGGMVDRELGLAVAAARAAGASAVALPSMGNAGQAAAMAASRAGLASHSFVPSRTPFVNKAMINVQGGDMTVVEGRYRDALAAYRKAVEEDGWYPLAPFATPFRQAGAKPIAYELSAARGWSAPDRVVVPTGQVTALVGIGRGFRDLEALGLLDRVPGLVAAQAEGCAPLAAAVEAREDEPTPVEHPDTVVGPLEIPEPAGGDLALSAIRSSGGTAVAVADDAILSGARTLAEAGVPASVTGGAAYAAAERLADEGRFDPADAIVLVNPVAGSKEADLMRSHLVSLGR
jgi:threonine synthase